MPASDISRLSTFGMPRSDMAATLAKEIAQREISIKIQSGHLSLHDSAAIEREYRSIYSQEYYKYYAHFLQQEQATKTIIYLKDPAVTKFIQRHTVANFSKLNCFIHVHRGCTTVGRINYPIDEDISMDTKEAFLSAWPGPLARSDDQLKRKISDYLETLWQHDSQRRIRYRNSDDQRKVILKLLIELLHRNGSIDAPGITRLLLRPEQTEIFKDEAQRKPLEIIQKYLLLGKRIEAIKFARTRKLWDHAQCLAFLDKYQPPNTGNYVRDGVRLRDDSIVQMNDEYISAIEQNILNMVYRSLLNRILQSDPESGNIVKHPNVGSNAYEFAILSANDCEMEFDQSNETFKLIMAVKSALNPIPTNHLISLGFSNLDTDTGDDLSFRSHLSYELTDNFCTRTLTISNTDMLILNEIWEYCLNLARGTCTPASYEYIMDLVPYKLMFASKLLDFGMHSMFAHYLNSMKSALYKAKSLQYIHMDPFYDWELIEQSVDNLSRIWDVYMMSPDTMQQFSASPETLPQHMSQPIPHTNNEFAFNAPPPSFNTMHSLPTPLTLQNDFLDSAQQESLPYQGDGSFMTISNQNSFGHYRQHNIPPQTLYNQRPPIQEEMVTDFNPDPLPSQMEEKNPYEPQQDYSNDTSRRQSTDVPLFSPIHQPPTSSSFVNQSQKMGSSSSPVHRGNRESIQSPVDSFNSPFSPINESDDLPRRDSDLALRRSSMSSGNNFVSKTKNESKSSVSGFNNSHNGLQQQQHQQQNQQQNQQQQDNNTAKAGDQQQFGFFGQLVGSAKALLPKNNSKQMILPDDSKPTIVYDEKRGVWVDTTKPEGEASGNELDAPPMSLPTSTKPPTYSFGAKTSKSRYPKAQF